MGNTIPAANLRHVRTIARDVLHDDARPDYRPMNRWYVIELDATDFEIRSLPGALRAAGYKVSVVGKTVKVTKHGLNWPETE